MTLDEQLELLAKFPQAVKAAAVDAEDRLVDVLGTVSSVQAAIAAWKKGAVSEVSDGEQGRQWTAKEGGSYDRSYNTQGLLSLIGSTMNWTLPETLSYLMQADIIEIKWKWTPLKKFMRTNGVDALIIKKEIEDGDPKWHIGEWWKRGYMSYKPIDPPAHDPSTK